MSHVPGPSAAASETGRDPLEAALAAEAETVDLGTGGTLLLGSGERVWRLVSGEVEVFAVDSGDGSRTHLATVGPGELLLGLDGGEDGAPGFQLLAAGRWGTRLLELPRRRLAEAAADSRLREEIARRLDTWVTALGHGLAPPPAPKVFTELAAGETLEPGEEAPDAQETRAVRPREEVVWVLQEAGSSAWLGRSDLSFAAGQRLPLAPATWLAAGPGARLSATATGQLLAGRQGGPAALWAGLDLFHHRVTAYVRGRRSQADHEQRDRLARRAELDRFTLETAYSQLASVLEKGPGGRVELDELADPLLAVCRRVGQTQGLEIRPPLASGGRGKASDHLQQIATASRVRTRRVLLREGWWRRDGGPLVGFVEEEGEGGGKVRRPVALLPASPRSYEWVDPARGVRQPVDADVAETLAGDAFMFYPPLPERPLGVRDLLDSAFRGSRRDLTTLLLMGAGGGLLGLLIPIFTGQIFGNVIPSADRLQLAQLALGLLVSALAAALFQVTRSIAVLRLGGRMDGSLQAAVWDRLLALPVSFFRRYTVGDLASRSMGIDAIRELLTGNVVTSVLGAVFSLFSFALLFVYSGRLALVATALVAVLLGVTGFLTWLQLHHQRELLRLQGKIASLVFGLINGLAKLRVGGAEHRAFALWAHRFAEQRQRSVRARRIANVQSAVNATFSVLTTLVIFAMVGLTAEASLPLGDFLAFNAAFGQFLAAALSMIGVFSALLAMVPLYERVSPILEEVPEADPSKADAGELAGDVELAHVSFRYREGGPRILDDVSLRARPGEFIALVGPSGAGKSTCLRLILGFERPETGSIYFDGQDLASLDLGSVRRQIGVVLQSGQPMAGDIFTNIIGGSNLTLDDAWEAAEMAGLADDIRAMPMGMHTLVSEGAGTFSGGQRQRLLIARAIVHRPRIVLFDEATSALDNRTQEVVSRSLERLQATRIVIAHRLSTIVGADRIYVLEGGRVVEAGTHEELMARGDVFARLAARQIA